LNYFSWQRYFTKYFNKKNFYSHIAVNSELFNIYYKKKYNRKINKKMFSLPLCTGRFSFIPFKKSSSSSKTNIVLDNINNIKSSYLFPSFFSLMYLLKHVVQKIDDQIPGRRFRPLDPAEKMPERHLILQKPAGNWRKKSAKFPVGILLPRSSDFRYFLAGVGPYFLTWDDNPNDWLFLISSSRSLILFSNFPIWNM